MKPKLKTLKNGLRIVTVPMKDNPTVTVMVMVEAGTRYETRETNGLSHFLEHMCFKGTHKRTCREIVNEIESMGAVTNAFTGYDYTGYYAKGRSELFPKLLEVVSDVYLNSTFPEAEIEKERGVICGEIDMYEDMPQAKVQYMGLEAIYGDQPAGYTILGPKENILKFTRKDFINYHKGHYVPAKTILVVAGGVEIAHVEKEATKAFGIMKSAKRLGKKKIGKQTGQKLLIKDKKTDQSHLYFGLRSVPLGHKDGAAFAVLVGALGKGMSSRLSFKLRDEMGAGYYVSADSMESDDTGVFEISTGTKPSRVPEVIQAVLNEVKIITQVPLGDRELAKSKEYLVGRLYMGSESTHARAEMAAVQAIFHQPLKTPHDIEKEIRKVTAQDVQKVAKKYLKPEHFHLALIGPHGNKEVISKVFGA
jgi:predicted Zn-dependent peptidase